MEITITDQEVKDLKSIRSYFGIHDKTTFEHKAYVIIDNLISRINNQSTTSSVVESFTNIRKASYFEWTVEQASYLIQIFENRKIAAKTWLSHDSDSLQSIQAKKMIDYFNEQILKVLSI
jgi:hypothetical protein